jgi:hypothetical protein
MLYLDLGCVNFHVKEGYGNSRSESPDKTVEWTENPSPNDLM